MRTSATDRLWRLGLWVAYRVISVGWYVFRPQTRGVFIAVWHNRELLLIRNSYRRWYALPAGGVRRGETPAHAALRELREEVGIAAEPEALHFAGDISTTFEFKRDRCSFFEVEFDARPDFCVDGREVIWADFLTPSAALKTRLAPPVRAYLNDRLVKFEPSRQAVRTNTGV